MSGRSIFHYIAILIFIGTKNLLIIESFAVKENK